MEAVDPFHEHSTGAELGVTEGDGDVEGVDVELGP